MIIWKIRIRCKRLFRDIFVKQKFISIKISFYGIFIENIFFFFYNLLLKKNGQSQTYERK